MTRGKSICSVLKTISVGLSALAGCSAMDVEAREPIPPAITRAFMGDIVETMPSFPGGSEALMKFLAENVKWPKELEETCVQGRVVVSFMVERDGSLTDIKVAKSVDPYLDREAVRVVRMMPKWHPGMQNGEPTRIKYVIPVTFRLQ